MTCLHKQEFLGSAGTVIARDHPNLLPRAGNSMFVEAGFQAAQQPLVQPIIPSPSRVEPIHIDKEQSKDISDFYSVENEVNFLNRYGGRLKQEEQFFYLVENQLRFLNEFAGHIKFSKIRYLLNEQNGLNFAGLNMIDMLGHTTAYAGDRSREGYENMGLIKIFEAFEEDMKSGKNQMTDAVLLSPPKGWDYSFAFLYKKHFDPFLGEQVVDMYPLMYDEKSEQLTESKKVLDAINPSNKNSYRTTEDYLTKPVLDTVPSLKQMLDITKISADDVAMSNQFQELVEQYLGPQIATYARGIMELYEQRDILSSLEYKKRNDFLELLRRSIFNEAVEIWKNKPHVLHQHESFEPHSSHRIIDRFTTINPVPMIDLQRMHSYGSQTIKISGGSCPVAQKSTSNSSFASSLEGGRSIENALAQNSINSSSTSESDEYGSLEFECPHENCGKKNRRPPHTLIPNCQHCGKDVRC